MAQHNRPAAALQQRDHNAACAVLSGCWRRSGRTDCIAYADARSEEGGRISGEKSGSGGKPADLMLHCQRVALRELVRRQNSTAAACASQNGVPGRTGDRATVCRCGSNDEPGAASARTTTSAPAIPPVRLTHDGLVRFTHDGSVCLAHDDPACPAQDGPVCLLITARSARESCHDDDRGCRSTCENRASRGWSCT